MPLTNDLGKNRLSVAAIAAMLTLAFCLNQSIAAVPAAGGRAVRNDSATSPTVRRRRPPRNLWARNLDNSARFDSHGIVTYRHETFVSKEFHFNGQAETPVGYAIYLPPVMNLPPSAIRFSISCTAWARPKMRAFRWSRARTR